jgi:hypothetical protein
MSSDFLPLIWGGKKVAIGEPAEELEVVNPAASVDALRPDRHVHERLIDKIENCESIRAELELNYKLINSIVCGHHKQLPSFPQARAITAASPRIPFDKKQPPSLYNSAKNTAGYERNITKEECKRRLEMVTEYVSA